LVQRTRGPRWRARTLEGGRNAGAREAAMLGAQEVAACHLRHVEVALRAGSI
jgi:hypothetical protein